MLYTAILCCEVRQKRWNKLNKWKQIMESRGTQVSRVKTEYMVCRGPEEEAASEKKKDAWDGLGHVIHQYLGVQTKASRDTDLEMNCRGQTGLKKKIARCVMCNL